jgi:Carboxypeptidase regulatory-like domain
MRRTFLVLGILLLVLLAARGVFAQQTVKKTTSATLSGVVLGPDDRPVPHASITYQSSGGNAPHAVHADSHGRFSIPKLKADNYDVRASGRGVFSEWEKNVTVRPGQQKTLTLHLIYAKQIPKAYVNTKPQQQ